MRPHLPALLVAVSGSLFAVACVSANVIQPGATGSGGAQGDVNVVYFDAATQRRLTIRMSQQLAEGGYLMLGHSEHAVWLSNHLEPVGNTIYHRSRDAARPRGVGSETTSNPAPIGLSFTIED